ncbi:hypothetical protein [Paractinoplanes atraurantiacus]|uniref:Uncharacterized protein n=1 Tax=Paractinoplanes atraurantiacus TaxID=1036182 RepID=A0A285H2W6_9ACTN|nr:hypothetical protein [Actinoplanes atraurantiacus]SNY30038.1 hypothetical protein SAMN05421748_103341 [Actinoplanes atraurantiacus]
MFPQSLFDHVLVTLAVLVAGGLVVLGVWTLTTRRVPRPLVRLRGETSARYPVRLGGFWVLIGAALLMSITPNVVDTPLAVGRLMFAAAGVALLSSAAWYAMRQS